MLYYVGYYNCDLIRQEKRVVAPASENKMGYMIYALSEANDGTFEVISPAGTKKCGFVKGKKYGLHDRVSLKTFSSFHSNVKIVRGMGHLLTRFSFFLYLLRHVGAGDHVIVYHSLAYMRTMKWLRRLKKCKLTIEVEELYSDVKCNEQLRKKELEYLQIADNYIFITELLRQQVNAEKKYLISHGTYRTNPRYSDKFGDGKIHLVYAGSFDPIKGGALSAVDAAEFLDERFALHVLGKGTASATETVVKRIEEVSQKTACKVTFDGYKSGKEFDAFIQSCHIGLSTQQPDGKYNASSFPSKILMYMSNGIPVVSIRIPAVDTSAVKDYVFYYDDPVPQRIAEAITQVPLNQMSGAAAKLDELHRNMVCELRSFWVS